MILNPAARVWILSGGQYTMRYRSLHRAYPLPSSLHGLTLGTRAADIKAVIGACKLTDGCSLALCSATVSVVSAGICHRNKVNSTTWLYRDGPSHKIVSFTLHYIKRNTLITVQCWSSVQTFKFISSYEIVVQHPMNSTQKTPNSPEIRRFQSVS